MERDELTTFLGSVLRAKFAYFRCLRQAEELEERCTSLSSPLSSEGGRGTSDVHKDNMLIALADKTRLLPELYKDWKDAERGVDRFLNEIEDDRYRAILKLRYVDMLRWSKIELELQKVGIFYVLRQIHNLHGEALNVARELWQKKNADSNLTKE